MDRAAQLPAVEYAERSDPGRDPEKQVNEDACGRKETRLGHLCVVCDGMGGHASGREAAELALETILDTLGRASEEASPSEALGAAIEEANRRVFAMTTGEVAIGRPGATVVAVLLHAKGTEVAHVGDSRAYLVHQGQIFRLTRDHSIVQELVDRGLLTPEQAVHHPEANRITRALGMALDVDVEVRAEPVRHVSGDAFVLCSDGLCDMVVDHEILAIVGAEPAAQAVGKLVDLANARGGHDNVTVTVLRARESATVATGPVAATVAQTNPAVDAPAGAVHVTRLEAPAQHVIHPPPAGGAPGRPLEPTPPPGSARPARRGGPLMVFALGLAVVAAVLLVGVLFSHFDERGGKRNPSMGPNAFDVPSSEGGHDTPTTLAPESVTAAPPASEPAEPIAPLDTSPTPSPGPHRHHHAD
jgi:protein phosphatase